MTENEFLLADRIQKIKSTVQFYGGEKNFFIAFSGGKDSTVLSCLVDMAIPENNIPRVYSDTGIELNLIKKFVYDLSINDKRIIILEPETPIKEMLERDGYPFKSKAHSEFIERYKRSGKTLSVKQYLGERIDKKPWSSQKSCPKCLKYQFTNDFTIKVSDKCCERLKEEPVNKWRKENKRPFAMLGLMKEEGGRRTTAKCISFKGKEMNFQPLVILSKKWEEWFINEYNIKICDIYNEPYNFTRTGCKGCPFNVTLQKELDTLEEFFPSERKQCEIIWKPIYDEYRRINYRLKGVN